MLLDLVEPTNQETPESNKQAAEQLYRDDELPEGMDALRAFDAAVEAGVAFVPGTHFYPDGGHPGTLRLNFSMCDVPTIEKGMERLAGVLAKL